ncbi:DUF1385 domain-containing protein [archaeon]|nr:DUF1385 domain-containing protein [archaeon]MBL7057291.1 DUF1385 domain-containing protein [Candidatus Woesearchaeota archaeon]
MAKKILVGGQAVIEGVLMRSPNYYAVAVRKPDDKITVKLEKYKAYTQRNKFLGFPFIRGIVSMIDTIALGSRALTYSANESIEKDDEKLTSKEIFLTILVSVVVALVVFKFLPMFLAHLFSQSMGLGNFWFNLVDGLIKLVILLGYLWVISLMSDVQRMFEYHGAEHMSVHCYEGEKKLTPKNAKKYKTMHPRCGTEFLLLVVIISIIFYMFIPFTAGFWMKYLLRILLLPIIAGVSYEVLRMSGLHHNQLIFKIISAPGMWLQRITTKQPTDKQLEVAIKSLEAVLKAEKKTIKSS